MTQQQTPIYIFIGPEGAGKSTQARMLAEQLHLPLISTGDLLRHFAKEDKGYLGEAARKMFAINGYLDAELMLKMMAEHLQNPQYANGVVLDGSLRTYDETVRFDEIFSSNNMQPAITVMYITIPEDESIKRLSTDRKRSDDIIQGIQTRLAHFHERLDERLAIIKDRYRFIAINGMQDKEAVHKEIVENIHV